MASTPYRAFVTRDYPGLTIDFEQPQLVPQDIVLNVIHDVYSSDFFHSGLCKKSYDGMSSTI